MFALTTSVFSHSIKLLLLGGSVACIVFSSGGTQAAEPKPSTRAVLVGLERVSPEFLAAWKAQGSTRSSCRSTNGRSRAGADGQGRRAGGDDPVAVDRGRTQPGDGSTPTPSGWPRSAGTTTTGGGGSRGPGGETRRGHQGVAVGPDRLCSGLRGPSATVEGLLGDLPGSWAGVFLNDLQAGPSSCGCGNDQCRWALDYGSPPTPPRRREMTPRPGSSRSSPNAIPARSIIPVWVTECELVDLPDAKGGTGLCGRVRCASQRLLAPLRPQLESAPQGDRRADRPGPLARDVSARRRTLDRRATWPCFRNRRAAAARWHPKGRSPSSRPGESRSRRRSLCPSGSSNRRRDGCSPSTRSINPGSRERCRW